MPRSIFEILDDYYYNDGRRSGRTFRQNQRNAYQQSRSIGQIFSYQKIRKGLETHQKMTVFKFMVQLDNITDVEFTEITIY